MHFRYMKRDESSPAQLAAKSTQNLGKGKKNNRGIILNTKGNTGLASIECGRGSSGCGCLGGRQMGR